MSTRNDKGGGKKVLLNEEINFPEVRCMSDDGEQHGIISSAEAYKIAQSAGLDLVLIAETANPPVVKMPKTT